MATCSLYNIPEGLHPNTSGYDAIAEVIQLAVN
jgi:lysophospholipase L1-like esterase